jgi:multiple sugar transport system ATP-binding protein
VATVTFDHVTKRFGEVVAVDDLDLEIHDGEFMVLVGPSGCGKTTSLRMIAGLEDVTEGMVKIGARIVNDVAPKDRDIAMVFQSYALYPHMTVYDNLAFGLKLHKVPKPEIDRRVQEVAAILHLERLLDRKPKALSGGQRQRVAVGRAIVREPAVFLMDEPLSNLDAKLRVQTRAELLRLHARLGTTTVYVTHDQIEAMTMGQRIAVMSEAVLQQVGTPAELYDAPANRFVAGFIGSPAMNFTDVVVRGSGPGAMLEAPGISIPVPARSSQRVADGMKLVLGLRPEHMQLESDASVGGTIAATVDVVEFLGNEELVHLDVAGADVIALLSAEHRIKPGDALELHVKMDRVYLFDPATSLALAAEPAISG